MKTPVKTLLLAVCVVAALFVSTSSAFACPSCYGDPESPMTDGMNMAILALLGITGSMLALFGAFFLYLRRRFRLIHDRFSNRLN